MAIGKFNKKIKIKLSFFVFLSLFINFPISIFSSTNFDEEIKNSSNTTLKNKETVVGNLLEDRYLLGAGDLIQLNVIDSEELSGVFQILSDGSISFPFIGFVFLSGLTIEQAEDFIKSSLETELLVPEVQISIIKARPIKISIVGQVSRPGFYSLSNNEVVQTEGGPITSTSGLPTVVDAIQKAGGITQKANLKNVVLHRRLAGIENKYKKKSLNLSKLIFEGDQGQNPFIFDGDILKINKAQNNSEIYNQSLEIAAANLTPDRINVYVVGEVKKPGLYSLPYNSSLSQAILAAGGTKGLRTAKTNIKLVRINRNGSTTYKRFKLNLSKNIFSQNNPSLKEGDSLLIETSLLGRTGDSIETITKPISGVVSVLTLFKLLE